MVNIRAANGCGCRQGTVAIEHWQLKPKFGLDFRWHHLSCLPYVIQRSTDGNSADCVLIRHAA